MGENGAEHLAVSGVRYRPPGAGQDDRGRWSRTDDDPLVDATRERARLENELSVD